MATALQESTSPATEPVSRHRRSGWGGKAFFLGLPAVVLGLLIFYPMCYVVYQAFTGTSRLYYDAHGFGAVFLKVLASDTFHSALFNTLIIASLSTIGCLVLGFILATIVAFVPFPGAPTLSRLIDAYLSFPSFLIAMSFTFLYGANGLVNGALKAVLGTDSPPLGNFVNSRWAVILAIITFYTPFVIRPLLAAFSQLDTAVIEAASSLGARPMRIIRRIILPESVPALLAGGSLTLVLTLNEFGIVAMIGAKGVTTLTLQIYGQAIINNDGAVAAVMAVVNVVLSLGLYSLYRSVLNRTGGGTRARAH